VTSMVVQFLSGW